MDMRVRWMGWVLGVCALGCGADDGDSGVADSGSSGADSGSSGGVDTSSTGDPVQASVLEQCDAPSPCDAITRDPGSDNEGVSEPLDCAVGQALAAIADGTPAGLTSSYCDIGCFGSDLLLVGDGTAYRQAWSTTDVTSFEAIERCTLKPASFFEPCQGQPWNANACTSFADWVTDCEAVTDAQCPG